MNMQLLAREIIKHLPGDFRETILSVPETGFIKDGDINVDGQWSLKLKHDENRHQVHVTGVSPGDKKGSKFGEMPSMKVRDDMDPAKMAAFIVKNGIIGRYTQEFDKQAVERDKWNDHYTKIETAVARYIQIAPGAALKQGSDESMDVPGARRWQVGPNNVHLEVSVSHDIAEKILKLMMEN